MSRVNVVTTREASMPSFGSSIYVSVIRQAFALGSLLSFLPIASGRWLARGKKLQWRGDPSDGADASSVTLPGEATASQKVKNANSCILRFRDLKTRAGWIHLAFQYISNDIHRLSLSHGSRQQASYPSNILGEA
jgi:hypothetical protein